MRAVLSQSNFYILRFDRGEEVVEGLKQFCQQEKISAGFFYGLGACEYLKLAYYDLEAKKYLDHEFNEDLEITNVSGNIAAMENELVIHMHGTFSDKTMEVIGGHVAAMKVAGTCEIFLQKFEGLIKRTLDQTTGLKLLD